ncbi:MAG TPA: DUF502 domain-containing protein [Thermoanaerobaculaceae bacterium]|nr:DUF502 domain-containing protein [Thermoanaerobaculaceae bacterium]HRS16171.1 DUF502 domain-containing protein [Thermoanaerobaculaceae bacterium]
MRDRRDPLDDSHFLPMAHVAPDARLGVVGFLRSRFVTGALIAFPLVVSIFFGKFIFGLLDSWSYPITKHLFGEPIPGAGAALAVLLIFALGILGHNVLGRRLLKLGERILARVPLVRPIYLGAREITRAFSADRTKSFRRVVLVPFPIEDVYVVAFLTGEIETASDEGVRRYATVFMPTTPNPTTGFYMLIPIEKVRSTSLTVEEAARMVISGGLASPEPHRILTPQQEENRP